MTASDPEGAKPHNGTDAERIAVERLAADLRPPDQSEHSDLAQAVLIVGELAHAAENGGGIKRGTIEDALWAIGKLTDRVEELAIVAGYDPTEF